MRQTFTGDTIQLGSRIPKSLHRAMVLRCLDEERPMQEWIAEALREHLDRCQARTRPRLVRGAEG